MHVEELFVEIEGCPNYAVSNYGTVVNVKTGRELKPWRHSILSKKLLVKLPIDGKRKNFLVHRLVAQAFFVDYSDDIDVKHLSGNIQDNCVTNLHLEMRHE